MATVVEHKRVNVHGEPESRTYSFTVVYEPLAKIAPVRGHERHARTPQPAAGSGYQVTVPLLPGLVTYGRTMAEARQMARDAIRCHIEGLLKDGERVPNEKDAKKETLRVALSA